MSKIIFFKSNGRGSVFQLHLIDPNDFVGNDETYFIDKINLNDIKFKYMIVLDPDFDMKPVFTNDPKQWIFDNIDHTYKEDEEDDNKLISHIQTKKDIIINYKKLYNISFKYNGDFACSGFRFINANKYYPKLFFLYCRPHNISKIPFIFFQIICIIK